MALVDSIIGVESGGNPNAKNPSSSASGLGQFIDSTWLTTIAQARPDLVAGKSREEILALKADPDLSRQMTEAYAAQNGRILSGAGFDANPGNVYLAHFAGPQGAVKVLSSDPSTPIGAVLGDAAVKANPFLRGMTAADLQAWAARKMGETAPQPQPAQPRPIIQPVQQQQVQQQQAVMPVQASQSAPIFAQPQPQQAQTTDQVPAGEGISAGPIFYAPRRPQNLTALRNAFQASGNRGHFLR